MTSALPAVSHPVRPGYDRQKSDYLFYLRSNLGVAGRKIEDVSHIRGHIELTRNDGKRACLVNSSGQLSFSEGSRNPEDDFERTINQHGQFIAVRLHRQIFGCPPSRLSLTPA
jgi:hypothetical protein